MGMNVTDQEYLLRSHCPTRSGTTGTSEEVVSVSRVLRPVPLQWLLESVGQQERYLRNADEQKLDNRADSNTHRHQEQAELGSSV